MRILLLLAYCFRGKELPILTRVGRKKERKQRNEEIRIVKTTQRKEARKKERKKQRLRVLHLASTNMSPFSSANCFASS